MEPKPRRHTELIKRIKGYIDKRKETKGFTREQITQRIKADKKKEWEDKQPVPEPEPEPEPEPKHKPKKRRYPWELPEEDKPEIPTEPLPEGRRWPSSILRIVIIPHQFTDEDMSRWRELREESFEQKKKEKLTDESEELRQRRKRIF